MPPELSIYCQVSLAAVNTLKKYEIPIIEGRYVSPSNESGETVFDFKAEDHRKRAGQIEVNIWPFTENLRTLLPTEPGEFRTDYLPIDSQTVYSTRQGEFQIALAKLLDCIGWTLDGMVIHNVTTQQFVEISGETIRYESYVTRHMRAVVIESNFRPWLMALSQAAQRLELLDEVECLYLTRIEDAPRFPKYYWVDPTDTPIYFLVQDILGQLKFIPEKDREQFRQLYSSSEQLSYALNLYLKDWEEGKICVITVKETAKYLRQIIGWVCRKYGFDEETYSRSSHDYLHKAQVSLIGLEPSTYLAH